MLSEKQCEIITQKISKSNGGNRGHHTVVNFKPYTG